MLKGAHLFREEITKKRLASYKDVYYNNLYLEKMPDFPIFTSVDKLADAIKLGQKFYDVASVDSNNNVVGRFTMRLGDGLIDNVEMVHYKDSGDILPFCRDLKSIIQQLEDVDVGTTVMWYVVDGNPIEKLHKKYLAKHSGKVESELVEVQMGKKLLFRKYIMKKEEMK